MAVTPPSTPKTSSGSTTGGTLSGDTGATAPDFARQAEDRQSRFKDQLDKYSKKPNSDWKPTPGNEDKAAGKAAPSDKGLLLGQDHLPTAEEQKALWKKTYVKEYGADEDKDIMWLLGGGKLPRAQATAAVRRMLHHHGLSPAEIDARIKQFEEEARLSKEAKEPGFHQDNSVHGEMREPAVREPRMESRVRVDTGGLKLAGGALAGYTAAHALNAGFEAFMARRVQGIIQGDKSSREHAFNEAGTAIMADFGPALKEAALSFVPGYSSYQAYERGNIGEAIMWLGVDAAGVAACALSLGTLAAPVEGVIYAAKVAGGVAHVANLGALGYMGYEGGTALLEYYKFLQTPSGTRLFEAAKKEFFGGGLSKNEAIALASDMFKAGEFKAEREKDKLLAENTPSSLIPAGLSGRQPLNGKPGMTPDVVAGLENAPTPGKNKLALDPPPVG